MPVLTAATALFRINNESYYLQHMYFYVIQMCVGVFVCACVRALPMLVQKVVCHQTWATVLRVVTIVLQSKLYVHVLFSGLVSCAVSSSWSHTSCTQRHPEHRNVLSAVKTERTTMVLRQVIVRQLSAQHLQRTIYSVANLQLTAEKPAVRTGRCELVPRLARIVRARAHPDWEHSSIYDAHKMR